MEESEFVALADAVLMKIAEAVEDGDADWDVEFEGGILTLEGDAGQYVINKHAPNRQVWLSSPVSGAWHFAWNGADWVSTRDASARLIRIIEQELGVPLN